MRTLSDLADAVADADLPLAFEAPGGAPAPGYHLTEVRLSNRKVLDCGGQISDEVQAEIQLMAGFGRPMTAKRFAGIVTRALDEIPGLAEAPLVAEVPTDDGQLALVAPQDVRHGDAAVTVVLGAHAAACRAVERYKAANAAGQTEARCCR